MALGGTYNTGMVGVTLGSATVSGSGVLWSDVVEGDWLQVGTAVGVIDSVNGGYDTITLKDGWAGATVPMGTATMTVASPCVVTWPATAPAADTAVVLSTTGALATGLTAGTTVYVKSPSGTSSNLAATPGGAAINTSGTQSGTHTIGSPYRVLKMSWLRYDPSLTQARLREFINLIDTSAVFGVPFEWDTGTSDADPGAGLIRANNASLASATTLYISKTSRVSVDVSAYLAALDDATNTTSKGVLILGTQPNGEQAIFTVGAVTDATGYIKLAISGASGVTSFGAGDLINFQFLRAGDVATGPFTASLGFDATNTLDIGTSATVLAPRTVYAGTSFVGPTGVFTSSILLGAGPSTLTSPSAAVTQLGAVTGAGAAVAQTLQAQGSSGNSAAAALLTVAGSDQSGTTTTGGGVKIRGGNGTSAGGAVEIWTSATTTPAVAISVAADKTTTFAGSAVSSLATGGIGYATGAGGVVTQLTSRTTGVTLNTVTGAITLVSAAGSATPQTFTVTNSTVAATDVIILNQKSGTDKNVLLVTTVAAGSFAITFYTTGGTTTEQPVFNFAVIKGKAA